MVTGSIFDVVVDIRRQSATYGKWMSTELSPQGQRMLWIPPGFAHGFLTVSESADVLYKVTAPYSAADERTILWNDPQIKIEWPLQHEPAL